MCDSKGWCFEFRLSLQTDIGRSIANYAVPVWSTNASNTSIGKIQTAQNEALRIATGAHLMSSIDHLHSEAAMMKVKEHSDLLSEQYLVKCLDPDHVCHNITTMASPPRLMKQTLHTIHHSTVLPLLSSTRQYTPRLSTMLLPAKRTTEYYAIVCRAV